MNFRFDTAKATEVACLLLEKAGGRMNIMKLVKLIYLLDRLSLDRRGIPVVGGDYLSMRNGPVTSELLDIINAGRLFGEKDTRWEQCISDRRNHDLKLEQMPGREHVSDAEVALADEIWAEHGGKDQWQLVEWCHTHCPEWIFSLDSDVLGDYRDFVRSFFTVNDDWARQFILGPSVLNLAGLNAS